MQLFPLLKLLDARISPETTKIHLATSNGTDNPIDVYVAGGFDEWQRWQNKRNFKRMFVLSLVQLREAQSWLFAGVHESTKPRWHEERQEHYYSLVELSSCRHLNGRLTVRFLRTGRQSYLNAENWADQIVIDEIKSKRLSIVDFPGYRNVRLSKEMLDAIATQAPESWRTALSSVSGVYLISDKKTGKLYVGSASGQGGIWQRWCGYSATGHGGNKQLKELLRSEGNERVKDFQFSILEITDIHQGASDVLARESHWKEALLARGHGFNSN
jgi:hypothetical protein